MTIKNIKEQTAIVKAQHPDTSVQSDTFSFTANKSLNVTQDVDQSNSTQTVYTNASPPSTANWTDTWTVPETGVYRLFFQMNNGNYVNTLTRLSIRIDDYTVLNPPADTDTRTVKTVRVLYAGTKVTFNADHQNFSTNTYRVNIQKLNNTTQVAMSPENYFGYPDEINIWNNNQYTASSKSLSFTTSVDRAVTFTLSTTAPVNKMYVKIDGKTIVEKRNVSSITFDGILENGQSIQAGYENDSSVTGTFSLTDTRRLYSGSISDSDDNPKYYPWPCLPPNFTVS